VACRSQIVTTASSGRCWVTLTNLLRQATGTYDVRFLLEMDRQEEPGVRRYSRSRGHLHR
jgi:hypothetical protein